MIGIGGMVPRYITHGAWMIMKTCFSVKDIVSPCASTPCLAYIFRRLINGQTNADEDA